MIYLSTEITIAAAVVTALATETKILVFCVGVISEVRSLKTTSDPDGTFVNRLADQALPFWSMI